MGTPGSCREQMVTEITCSSPRVHIYPELFPTKPGENRAPDEGCLYSSKRLHSSFRFTILLPHNTPGTLGGVGRDRLSVTLQETGAQRG